MLPKLTIRCLFASVMITGFFAVSVLAQYTPLPATNQSSLVVPAVLGADGEGTNPVQPVATVRHSKCSTWYNNGGYPTDYYSPYHSYNYWSERYRRQSYRFLNPGRVRRNFIFAYPYGYYPMLPPAYAPYPYGYGQYQQYTQLEQQPLVPQMTPEQREKQMQMKIIRQIDNISQAFVLGNYDRAIVRAQQALKQMPDNTMLRFTYSQTLFADGRFQNAAITVRSTLEMMAQTGQQDVFYPMSLYPDQTTLSQQIDRLIVAINAKPHDASLKLLLGYQLLGVGRIDEAVGYLQKASQDTINEKAALYLVKVSSKMYRNFEPSATTKQAEEPNEPNIPAEKSLVAEPNC
jgi:tetratricopeptide (TPR) repeat protein